MREKVDDFVGLLASKKIEDVQNNAHVLAEIVKNFSLTFGVESAQVLRVMNECTTQGGGLNIEEVRRRLLSLSN